jgi:hypothetical protein
VMVDNINFRGDAGRIAACQLVKNC